MPARRVITHPAVTVERNGVATWCATGPLGGTGLEPLGADVAVDFPASTEALVALVASLPPEDPITIVTRPGAADAILAGLGHGPDRKIVWVELEAPTQRRSDARPLIRGRGVNGYHWAVRTMHWRWQVPFRTIAYGPEPEHVGELRLPIGEGPFPLVVVVHGGYYREQWERDTAEPTAIGLTRQGFATWNIEYRRCGPGGDGGWPNTFLDVAAAVDHVAVLAREHPIDLDRVVVAGHSAGGHLALWAAARRSLPVGAPGAGPVVSPALAVSLAGVVDLALAAERGVGFGHNPISAVMGGMPAEVGDRYALASPYELPVEVPQLLIQGVGSDDPDLIDINRRYAAAHPEARYVEVEGADHFDITYPDSPAWETTVAEIDKQLGS
jgi:acetyl esterase/lipase